jgi:hypothetical protein
MFRKDPNCTWHTGIFENVGAGFTSYRDTRYRDMPAPTFSEGI